MERAPPSTLITIVKNAPRKVTNAIDSSCVGQKMIEAGTQASGGIGRSTSKGGKKMRENGSSDSQQQPKRDADKHRGEEAGQHAEEAHVPAFPVTPGHQHLRPGHQPRRLGAGNSADPREGEAGPLLEREPTSHRIRNTVTATSPRQSSRRPSVRSRKEPRDGATPMGLTSPTLAMTAFRLAQASSFRPIGRP